MYGKVMSFPDDQIIPCFELCTDVPLDEIDAVADELETGANPMVYKKRLAYEITRLYHGVAQAQRAQEAFEREVQRKERPADIPVVDLEGAVYIDGDRVGDPKHILEAQNSVVIKLGRHYRRVKFPA
jgi:tyrosyl-tRNA synthetase